DLNDSITETRLDFSGWVFVGWGGQGEYVEIIGSGRNETITGTTQSDVINGGGGNDTIADVGGGTDVTLLGGTGIDVLDLSGSAFGWQIDMTDAGTNASSGTATGRVDEFETITGSELSDDITGDLDLSILYGGDGNDRLTNAEGAASLYGGEGNDTLQGSGSGAVERLEGGNGNDTFRLSTPGGDYSNELHLGGIGFDRQLFTATTDGQTFDTDGLEVNSIEEIEFAAIGQDKDITVALNPDEFNINGAEYSNNLLVDGNSATGSTEILRVDLNDSITETRLDFSGWVFVGWGGQGEYVEIIGSGRNETITGTTQNDSISGGAGVDTITGGDGVDTIEGGAGADILNGGTGDNFLSHVSSSAGVTVNLNTNSASGGDATGDTFFNFLHLTGSGHGDNLSGDSGENTIQGLGGNDTIEGSAGNDVIYGGAGNDMITDTAGLGSGADSVYGGTGDDIIANTGGLVGDFLDGGAGNDTLDQSGSVVFGPMVVDLTAGTIRFLSGTVQSTAINFENYLGDNLSETVLGTSGANLILGNSGNDSLEGLDGADQLYGGVDDDTLEGGRGSDIIDGGGGIDTATYENATAGVTVKLAKGEAFGGDNFDLLTDIENLIGSDHDDKLVSDIRDNVITSGDGDDLVRNLGGQDTINSGLGDDEVFGIGDAEFIDLGDGNDVARTKGGGDIVIMGDGNDRALTGGGADFATGDAGNDLFFMGSGNDTAIGGTGDDTLNGGSNADILDGGDGDDRVRGDNGMDQLNGGGGNDLLNGGANADLFWFFDISNMGQDRITDFQDGLDTINLSDFGFGSAADVLALASSAGGFDQHTRITFIDGAGGQQRDIVIENLDLADFDATDIALTGFDPFSF
ncbi:MAG: calcium-binding protein, partial [Paracoccaceae bacterium]